MLYARLRSTNIDPSVGALKEVERLWRRSRNNGPSGVQFARGWGFCRDARSWCEDHGVGYVFGLAKNKRLVKRSVDHRGDAVNRFSLARVLLTFDYLGQFGVTV